MIFLYVLNFAYVPFIILPCLSPSHSLSSLTQVSCHTQVCMINTVNSRFCMQEKSCATCLFSSALSLCLFPFRSLQLHDTYQRHTHASTHTHTYLCPCMHAIHIHTCMHTTHTHAHTNMHTCKHAHSTHIHACMYALYKHTCTHITHVHTYIRIYTHDSMFYIWENMIFI